MERPTDRQVDMVTPVYFVKCTHKKPIFFQLKVLLQVNQLKLETFHFLHYCRLTVCCLKKRSTLKYFHMCFIVLQEKISSLFNLLSALMDILTRTHNVLVVTL